MLFCWFYVGVALLSVQPSNASRRLPISSPRLSAGGACRWTRVPFVGELVSVCLDQRREREREKRKRGEAGTGEAIRAFSVGIPRREQRHGSLLSCLSPRFSLIKRQVLGGKGTP
jgi:hypothetical protein